MCGRNEDGNQRIFSGEDENKLLTVIGNFNLILTVGESFLKERAKYRGCRGFPSTVAPESHIMSTKV